jgi:hypothetical protein
MSHRLCWVAVFAAMLGGCATYGSPDVSRMSTYDICALQVNQGPNLTGSSRQLMQAELAKRKEDCAPHMRRIQAERDELLYELTYRNQSP